MQDDARWNVVWGSACPTQLRQLVPEDVRSQLKFREVLERNYSYIRVKAQIAGTDRPVAVHLIENVKLDTRPGLREQVQHTIQCYAGLEHDHILQFFVAFEDATFVYVVTELETGHEVQDLLRCHPSIPDAEVHGIAVAGVSALVYLHRKGLIHGAISPQSFVNCQFTWKVKFPIVNDAAHSPGNNRHLPYLAPEQVNKQSEQPYRSCLTPKVDMWNLAAVLFHCLVGYAPFGPVHVGEDPTEGILRDEPFIPYAIPPVLRWIIQQGLTKPVQLRCSALDAWIALLQAEADELHSDSDAESCSLPMWARHDDESDSILAWPEDESPKWMVSTVPDVAGPSDQVAGDESLHCLGVFGRLTGASGSDTCSGSMFGMPEDFLHEAAHGLPTKHCSEIEHSMGLQLSESGLPLDTISSCPASPSCSHMHEKQLPVAAAGCSQAPPEPGASRGMGDIGFNKRSRQLIQHLTTNPPREISTTTASLDTSDSSRDQHQTHRRAPRWKHAAEAGSQELQQAAPGEVGVFHRVMQSLAPVVCFGQQRLH